MAKTFTNAFAQQPRTATAVVSAATALTGANSLATDTPACTLLLTAGADGSLLTRLWAMPRQTISATGLYLLLHKASDPAGQARLIDSMLMAAYSLAATTMIPQTVFSAYNEGTPLRLDAGDQLFVASGVAFAAGGIVFRAELTDF